MMNPRNNSPLNTLTTLTATNDACVYVRANLLLWRVNYFKFVDIQFMSVTLIFKSHDLNVHQSPGHELLSYYHVYVCVILFI